MRRYGLLSKTRLGMSWHWLLCTLFVLGIVASSMVVYPASAQEPDPIESPMTDPARIEELLQPEATLQSTLASSWESSFTIANTSLFNSAYGNAWHRIDYAVPNSYNGDPIPLLVALHGYSGDSQSTLKQIGPAMASHPTARNWLLVSVDQHNASSVHIPTSPYDYHIGGKRAFAWLGAQHDVIDAIQYLRNDANGGQGYNIDTSRIYVAGGSMGGLTTSMMAAKYPDVFAAAAPWKPITDMTEWYDDLLSVGLDDWTLDTRAEADPSCTPALDNTCGTPDQVPFEYARRSPRQMAQNLQYTPLHLWHDTTDTWVMPAHSSALFDAVKAYNDQAPITLELVTEDPNCNWGCHLYAPPPISTDNATNLFDFLAQHTLPAAPPADLHIRTDESKPFYWLDIARSSEDHWTEIDASYDADAQTVSATVTDAEPLTVRFNLGSTPAAGPVVDLPGLGMPADTYLVQAGSSGELVDYDTGYLPVDLEGASSYNVTIAPITATLSAAPPAIDIAYTRSTSVTVTASDVLGSPLPDGTAVEFATTLGRFESGSTAMASLSGGQASVILSSEETTGSAEVSVTIGSLTASRIVSIVHELDNTPPITTVSGPTLLSEVDENSAPTMHTLSNFFDDAEDAAEALAYTLESNTNADLFAQIEIVDDQMTLTYAPDTFGSADLTIRATDRAQLFVEHTFRVVVNEVNNMPQAADDTANTRESTEVTIAVLDNDSDPDGDLLSLGSLGQPKNGTTRQAADGSSIIYTPAPGFTGEDSFVYAVSDDSLTATAQVFVTVDPKGVSPSPTPEPTAEPTPEPTAEPTPSPTPTEEPKQPSTIYIVHMPLVIVGSS